MKRLLHWLAHKLGSNTGDVEVWWSGKQLMVGFRCDGCGKLSGVHESVTTRGVKIGCDETGEAYKDPRECWNVRCQLGKRCCRSDGERQ